MQPFFFGGDPEAVRTELQKANELNKMQAQDWHNAVKRFIVETPPEHLVTVRKIVAISSNDGSLGSYIEGMIAWHLEYEHGLCSQCGDDHSDERVPDSPAGLITAKLPEPSVEQVVEQIKKETGKPQAVIEGQMTIDDVLGEPTATEPIEPDRAALMAEYKVRYPEDGEGWPVGTVICTVCSHNAWPSLEDRMLRSPDHCDQCIHHNKWGYYR